MFLFPKTNWKYFIDLETQRDYWNKLTKVIELDCSRFCVLPSIENVFRCFEFFNVENTKVVILGQDPYPTKDDACGLAFSVNRNTNLPHSLQNMFKELHSDLGVNKTTGDLTSWAKQGVLLLNASLTFCQENDHANLWKDFTIDCLKYIDTCCKCVFIFLGKKAQVFSQYIVNNNNNIITAGHPSFAHSHKGFFGCKIFSRTNELLKKIDIIEINW